MKTEEVEQMTVPSESESESEEAHAWSGETLVEEQLTRAEATTPTPSEHSIVKRSPAPSTDPTWSVSLERGQMRLKYERWVDNTVAVQAERLKKARLDRALARQARHTRKL